MTLLPPGSTWHPGSGNGAALWIPGLVLPMVYGRRNAKTLHFVEQRGALQTEPGSCPARPPELPIGAPASSQNFVPHLVFKCGI